MSTTDRIQACRASDGSYAFVYTASGKTLAVRLRDSFGDPLAGKVIRAYWYDPRSGTAVRLEDYTKPETGARSPAPTYTPPSSGSGNDWVLVLEDASKNFPVPGAKRQ
jgi:hypothetical protein